jgi:hypothetical protein
MIDIGYQSLPDKHLNRKRDAAASLGLRRNMII